LGYNQRTFDKRLQDFACDVLVALIIDFDGPIERFVVVPEANFDFPLYGRDFAVSTNAELMGIVSRVAGLAKLYEVGADRLPAGPSRQPSPQLNFGVLHNGPLVLIHRQSEAQSL
jgi:hypothetical protein